MLMVLSHLKVVQCEGSASAVLLALQSRVEPDCNGYNNYGNCYIHTYIHTYRPVRVLVHVWFLQVLHTSLLDGTFVQMNCKMSTSKLNLLVGLHTHFSFFNSFNLVLRVAEKFATALD